MVMTVYPITQKQASFLKALCAERPTWAKQHRLDEPGMIDRMNAAGASDYISMALAQPKEVASKPADTTPMPKVPAGYYAIPSATGSNDLDFFTVDRPTEGKWAGRTFVNRVVGGNPDAPVYSAQARTVLERIIAYGVRKAMALYGQQIGKCGRCGRHLTDEDSRTVGLGPDCASK